MATRADAIATAREHLHSGDFIAELNRRLPGLHARLPTEAEWEYACRAGTATPFACGEQITPAQANYHGGYPYAGGQQGPYREKTVPAASLPANPWGLFEMHGNVWEWCADWYDAYPEGPQIDPSGPSHPSSDPWKLVTGMLRGGSWYAYGKYCRAAFRRGGGGPARRDFDVGFRLVIGQRPGDRKSVV